MNIRQTFLDLTSKTYPYKHEDKLLSFLPNGYQVDKDGNYFYEIGDNNTTIFASHLDTACKEHGDVTHVFDGKFIRTDKKTILGADDKAGVTILLYMIEKNIPGLYYFFIGEEVGCIGSTAASKRISFFSQFKKIISFDRRGTTSIITHQSSKRGCSDEFADSLSREYKKHGLVLSKDDTGVYTDSAEFMSVIPECTNISVGYYREHTHDEHQDIEFLEKIAEASALVNWDLLEVKRDPSKTEWKSYGGYSSYRHNDYSERGYSEYFGTDDYDYRNGTRKRRNRRGNGGGGRKQPKYLRTTTSAEEFFDDEHGQWPSNSPGRVFINNVDNEVTEGSSDYKFDSHRTDYYKGVRGYFLNDQLTKNELLIIKEQCLNMSDESDRDFFKYMSEKYEDYEVDPTTT